MLLGIPASSFTISAGAGTVNISMSVHLSLLEASSVILKDPSHSDNASILFVLLELVLSHPHSFYYMYFVLDK